MAYIEPFYLFDDLRETPERILADRSNPLESLTDTQVHRRYRFRKENVLFIVGLVADTIKRPTRRSFALPPLFQVLVTLRFLASGSFYGVVADGLPRIGVSSVCRAVWEVVGALLAHFHTYVKFPHRTGPVNQEFYSIAGFPNVIGIIDGTQVPIQAPSSNENVFVNRKGTHSINCQMVCDPWMRITNVVAKWPGSVHDARILRESQLGIDLQAGKHPGIILGDSGYPCRRYLMVPYPNPEGRAQNKFNSSLTRTRVLIEQCFGILKRKFAALKFLRVEPTKACQVICATVMLHNIAIMVQDIDDEGDIPPADNENIVYRGDDREQEKLFRNEITLRYFN